MASVHYKKLFEVRLLHEYYLASNSANNFFALNDQQRNDTLRKAVSKDLYDTGKDLLFEPTEESKMAFSGHHIRFVPQRTGFMIAVKVRLKDNQFYPYIPFDESLDFNFRIGIDNPAFLNTINYRLGNTVPAVYYFTNSDTGGQKTFPALAVPVAPFSNTHNYEMGVLAVVGGDLMEALKNTNSAAPEHWRKVQGSGLVNDGDRVLLPRRFYYSFPKGSQVTSATIVLKTVNGSEVISAEFNLATGLEKVLLDYRTTSPGLPEIKEGFYRLEVTGDNNFQDQRLVYLHDVLYNPAHLGVVSINHNNSAFHLLQADGSIRNPAPVFEIRFKSRISYWRYLSDRGKALAVTPKTNPYLKAQDGSLQTIDPMPLTFFPIQFKKADPAVEKIFLPNPPRTSLRPEGDGRIYSEIYLSKIKELITEVI